MKLEGIHHITAITENAQRNVDFYAGVMGLRLVKKTVNQDNPTVYHLFFADEDGDPGSDLTFFEYPGAAPGRAGAGMVHRIVWRVASADSLDFWAERPRRQRHRVRAATGDSLRFADPEGLEHELLVVEVPDEPLIADHPEVPAELALQGFHAVRAYSAAPEASSGLLEALEFERAERRPGRRAARAAAASTPTTSRRPSRGLQGAGSVHHIAWASQIEEHMAVAREGDRGRRPADPGDRPLLLQVDLLPRAERRAVRDRHAWAPASPSTSRSSTSARSSRCRPTTSTCATRSSRTCARSRNPRVAAG